MSILLLLATLAPGASGEHIAFLLEEDGQTVAHVAALMDGMHRAVGAGPEDGAPIWSPDGSALAFTVLHEGERAIAVWTMAEDRLALLGLAKAASERLTWSPDGARIAFEIADGDAWRVGVVEVASGDVETWGGGAEAIAPVWLHDGEIARGALPEELTSMGPALARDGALMLAVAVEREAGALNTRLVVLTRQERFDANPRVLPGDAPHGEWLPRMSLTRHRLAYESTSGGNREIFSLLPESGSLCLSNHRAADWNPQWAPSGMAVMFESFRGGRRGLYAAHAETAHLEPLAAYPDASCWGGTWAPNSRRFAFVSDRGGVPRVWLGNRNGDDPSLLTASEFAQGAPAWQP